MTTTELETEIQKLITPHPVSQRMKTNIKDIVRNYTDAEIMYALKAASETVPLDKPSNDEIHLFIKCFEREVWEKRGTKGNVIRDAWIQCLSMLSEKYGFVDVDIFKGVMDEYIENGKKRYESSLELASVMKTAVRDSLKNAENWNAWKEAFMHESGMEQ